MDLGQLVSIENLDLFISAEVYFPREDTFLFLDYIKKQISKLDGGILEIGSGSGILIVYLSVKFPKISNYATDLNFIACQNTLKNLKIQNCENTMVVCSNLFSCFRKSSIPELIIFNPPYLPEDPIIDPKLSFNERIQFTGGKYGFETLETLLSNRDVRKIVTMISSNSISIPDFAKRHENYKFINLGVNKMEFEELYIVKMVRGDNH